MVEALPYLLIGILSGLLVMLWPFLRQRQRLHTLASSEQRLQQELDEARQRMAELDNTRIDLEQRLHQEQQTRTGLDVRLQEREQQHQQNTRHWQQQLDERQAQIGQLKREQDSARANQEALRQQLADTRQTLERQQAEADGLRGQLDEYKQRLADTDTALQQKRQQYEQLNNRHTELETRQQEKEQHLQEQLVTLKDNREQLKTEFQNLANQIFDAKGKAFSESSRASLDDLLKPFREQLDGFQKRVNEVHDASLKGRVALESEIRKVLDVGLKMSDEANALTSALKGDKKSQGNWGEMQVELLFEHSGLRKGIEYEREASFKTDEGQDQRPDFIVKLPQNKHLIVDSKISLNAYVAAQHADEEEKVGLLKTHAEALRRHVKSLSDKNYPKLKGVEAPEFVFMFIGNEPAYLAAMQQDPGLLQDAYRRGVAIVTPSTLLASLRIVHHLWSIDKQNQNTRNLAEQASKVYEKLRVFVGKMERLGNQINTLHNTYDDSWNTLKDGRGSLVRQVHKFVDLGVSVKESLPANVTDSGDAETPQAAPTGSDADQKQAEATLMQGDKKQAASEAGAEGSAE